MASAGVVARDSQVTRPPLQPNIVRDPSNQTVAPSFSDIGIVLPSVHLGSFSTMNFDSLPRTASTSRASSPEKRQRVPLSSDIRSPFSQSGVRQVTDHNNARAVQTAKQGAGELSSDKRRFSSASRSSRISSSRVVDQTNGPSSTSVPIESVERVHALSTLAGASYTLMLPTPVPSTVSSSQLARTPARETPPSPQQPLQPRRRIPPPLASLSSAEEDEPNDSFNVNATPPRSANGRTDGERVRDESGTPQLKVVNGQHIGPRRVESVDYTLPPPYEGDNSWVPSPSVSAPASAPYRRSTSTNSSPPPPRGAALPEPSSSMYATQVLPYPGPTFSPQSQRPSILTSSSSPPALSQQRPPRSIPPAALSQSQSSSQAGPPQSYTFPPPAPAAQPPQPLPLQAQYIPRQPPPPVPIQLQAPVPVPVAQPQTAQRVVPPEEVCIECMMRDRDMAEVDVTSPGVWERESDVWYEELVRREVEEARRGTMASANSNKPRSKGDPLTEANLNVWLTMNPKEPAARWQTLEKYVKAQAELLAAENDARETTLREARTQDSRIRDTFHHVRRSTGVDAAARVSLGGDNSQKGVKLHASTAYEEVDPYGNLVYGGANPRSVYPSSSPPLKRRSRSKERDVTLLESGLIMERVDIQKEEKEERARQKAEEKEERRRTRKISRVSTSGFGSPLSDASSMHSISAPIQGVNYSSSRSQISLTAGGSVNGASGTLASSAKRMSSPLTLIPPRPLMPRGTSQNSAESKGTARLFSFRHWSGAFGSEASLHHNSGSMMDMHLGLEQDREMVSGAQEEQNWTISQLVDGPDCAPEHVEKDKRSSIGRLWKKMTSSKDKDARYMQKKQVQQVEDLNTPLDPPPPLSYLVSRSPHERSPQRHVSSPSRQSFVALGPSHPRSMSAPSSGVPSLPASAASAASFTIPPSPSAGASQPRYSPRDSVGSGDERRFSQLNVNDGIQQFVPVISEDGVYDIQDRPVNAIYSRPSAGPFATHDPYGNEWGTSHSRTPAQTTLNGAGRPMSISSTEKELPPLPGGARPPVPHAARSFPVLRPITSYEFLDYHPPMAPFKSDVRRQSFSGKIGSLFGGSRSRQNSDVGLVPPARFGTIGSPDVEYGGFGYYVDEFGASTPSLGRWTSRTDDGQREIPVTTYSIATSKKDKRSSRTRSRGFSGRLSAIFGGGGRSDAIHGRENAGRRSMDRESNLRQSAMDGSGLAPSDGERYARQSMYASHPGRQVSRSDVELRQSVSSLATFPRLSVASSRRYEAVIPQERDFIAMRYPTESERLNLMRQS